MLYILLAGSVIIILVLLFILQRISPTESRTRSLPYTKRRALLTPAETAFYRVALQAIPADTTLFSKVRLADLLSVAKGTPQAQSHRNRIHSKHVDFVLCTQGNFAPVLAIELDDSSHNKPSRKSRDEFVDQAFAAADLPLLHVTARRSYNLQELASLITESIDDTNK